jgi:hypothetical protein
MHKPQELLFLHPSKNQGIEKPIEMERVALPQRPDFWNLKMVRKAILFGGQNSITN